MRYLLAGVLALVLVSPAAAALMPDEVAVIAMAASPESQRLAKHYLEARGIPQDHLLLLPGKPAVSLSRQAWDSEVRPAIRDWLVKKGLAKKVRCLVTCWDVPLRIDRRERSSTAVVERTNSLTQARQSRIKQFAGQLKTLDALGTTDMILADPVISDTASIADLTARFDTVIKSAQSRLGGMSIEQRKRASEVFEKVFVTIGGLNGLMQVAVRQSSAGKLKADAAERVELLQGELQGLDEGIQALGAMPDTLARDLQILHLTQKTGGLLGSIQWIDQQQELLTKNETMASFDSELALVLWPEYPLFRWIPNLLFYQFQNTLADPPTTLMVARLEAPTFARAMDLIDAAIATERNGLTGKIYIDARGMNYNPATDKTGSYAQYDQSLRDLAERIHKHTKLQVVLDNTSRLFQPGDCPDAALYCGWYSLGKYVDAFTWRPGAVAYHIASSEATTLRTPGGQVWCNAMLERGVAGTLGPTFEPYLAAFPLPDDFFSMLLTGRYTLAEAFYRTNPFNSWAMVLVGDPLYNPFRLHPALSEEDLPERIKHPPPPGPVRVE